VNNSLRRLLKNFGLIDFNVLATVHYLLVQLLYALFVLFYVVHNSFS